MLFYQTMCEPLLECFVVGPLGILSACQFSGYVSDHWVAAFAAHVMLWFVSDMLLMATVHDEPTAKRPNLLFTMCAWFVTEEDPVAALFFM